MVGSVDLRWAQLCPFLIRGQVMLLLLVEGPRYLSKKAQTPYQAMEGKSEATLTERPQNRVVLF